MRKKPRSLRKPKIGKNDIQFDLELFPQQQKEETTKPKWTVESVRTLLETDEQWRIRAFNKLWDRTERHVVDGKGFNRFDYHRAKQIWRNFKTFGNFDPDDKYWMATHIPKYAAQLYNHKHNVK